ncbi:MAG: hypothetical protein JWO05_1305 [Gemmatimonadetes bacterium]|nr:hypothetical protein [Gemmatimonadota bacterium]
MPDDLEVPSQDGEAEPTRKRRREARPSARPAASQSVKTLLEKESVQLPLLVVLAVLAAVATIYEARHAPIIAAASLLFSTLVAMDRPNRSRRKHFRRVIRMTLASLTAWLLVGSAVLIVVHRSNFEVVGEDEFGVAISRVIDGRNDLARRQRIVDLMLSGTISLLAAQLLLSSGRELLPSRRRKKRRDLERRKRSLAAAQPSGPTVQLGPDSFRKS